MDRSQCSTAAAALSWACALWALWALSAPARALVDAPRLIGNRAYEAQRVSSAPSPYTAFAPGPASSASAATASDITTFAFGRQPVDPVASTHQGTMRGSLMLSRLGRVIYAFRGIRFAQPPVGNLRFQPPQPYPKWKGVYNATSDGPACPQENGYSFPTDEDCLFLNVYTTDLPKHSHRKPKRPVFIFIHMGGWYGNTARSDNLGPQYMADQDVVIVTFNYRLGALGFISTDDEVLTGNYGMKDQVAAMRWVKENIASFGGNPKSVTLAGYSAGAASVWFHMASPMSRGLFHRAMSLSPCINAQADRTQDIRDPLKLARRQAKMSGCTEYKTSHQIKNCLMKLPAQNITGVLAAGDLYDWGPDPVLIWFPVVEADTPGEEHFLTEEVDEIFTSGDFTQVPWIAGRTRNEFDWRASTVYDDEKLRRQMSDSWYSVAPKAFMYVDSDDTTSISRKLRAFYLNEKEITADNVDSLGQLYSDSIIGFGVDRAAKVVAENSRAPVWFYEFAYQGRYSYNYRGNTTIPYGVMHQDDVMYFLYLSALFPFFDPDAPEIWAVERMTKLWANFAIHGNPTPQADPMFNGVVWEPMTPGNLNYLSIGNNSFEMRQGLFQDRMNTWENLFPLDDEDSQSISENSSG